MSVLIAPGISACPAVLFKVQKKLSAFKYHHEGGVDGEDDGDHDGEDGDQYLWIGVDSA